MTQQFTISPSKKLLDEGSFQELLAAAFVLQQHNELPSSAFASLKEVVSEIVRIQRLIRNGHSDVLASTKLISQQVQKFTHADGVAVGIVTDEVIYLAAIGTASQDIGRRVPREISLPAHCIRTGATFRSSHTQHDPRMLCERDDVRSLIAVPVEYDSKVVGVLEARFQTSNAFTDDDVRTCELIAGLVKEVITRVGRTHVTQDIEQHIEPEQQSASPQEMVDMGGTETLLAKSSDEKLAAPSTEFAAELKLSSQLRILPEPEADEVHTQPVIQAGMDASAGAGPCRGCGQYLTEEELFCGKCGTERNLNPAGPLQSKWASLWYMNEARKTAEDQAEHHARPEPSAATPNDRLLEAGLSNLEWEPQETPAESLSAIDDLTYEATVESAKPSVRLEWLPDVTASVEESWFRHQWRINRANFYLVGAAVLLILVLSGLGTTPALDPHPAAGPQLTLFERMLVGLGVAEAPQAAEYRGNPDTPVWVDLHTALYYCPGSDLYGKTDGGKIATQRSAQMDQFEPAHRKACN